jgi:hypothetical protein
MKFDKDEIKADAVYHCEETADNMHTSDMYHPDGHFDNPLKNSSDGMSNTWTMNLLPNGTTHMIASADSMAKGVAKVADIAFENWRNHRFSDGVVFRPGQLTCLKIGLISELVDRFGLGAYGEIDAARRLNADFGDDNEEKKGIDLKTENTTYQVKTGEKFKSSWDKKQADVLLWMETNGDGEIVEMHEK